MKEVINRDYARKEIISYRLIGGNGEVDLNDPTIESDTDLYMVAVTQAAKKRKGRRRQFDRVLSVYREYFKKHNNAIGLELVNKLIGDRKVFDKCCQLAIDGENPRYNIGIFISEIADEMVVVKTEEKFSSVKEAINYMFNNYEFIPCYWQQVFNLFDLEKYMEEDEKIKQMRREIYYDWD
jgi:hypothetical protein